MFGLQDPAAEIEYRQQRVRTEYRRANPDRPHRGVDVSRTSPSVRVSHGLRRLHLARPAR